jgi:transposase
METMYYIGLDVHKKTINSCVKDGSGRIYGEGSIPATRLTLDIWMKTLPQPWTAAMEATIFTAWIYDHLQPHAAAVKVAHPLMLRAIAVAKKKNDRIDAKKIADCLRCDFLPECYMASTEIRERSLNGATKYVATHRPESLGWGPAESLGSDIVAGVGRIKAMDGPHLIV